MASGRKLPWFKFYPGAWRNDPDLRRCSAAARGVWMDMLCIAFECDVRGVFATNGTAWTKQEIAEAIGGDITANRARIDELLRKGVASQAGGPGADDPSAGTVPEGAIYSRRMIADERKRGLCSAAGIKGGGNPTFKGVSKGHPKGESTNGSKHTLTSNVLSSLEEGIGGAGEGGKGRGPPVFELTAEGLAQAWCFCLTRRNRSGYPADTVEQVVPSFAELLRLGVKPEDVRAEIESRSRDHDEHVWQFRDRLKRNAGLGRKRESPSEMTQRINAEKKNHGV